MENLKNKMKSFFKADKVLILILLGSFGLSLFYSFHFKIKPQVDARAYDVIASNILLGNGYRENMDKDIAHDYAIARVGPLYQYFLAGLYKIFGHHYEIVWITQAILHALTAWLIYGLSVLIFLNSDYRKEIALLAAAIVGFYPDLIEISAMLMSETLYLFLVCWMLYLFFRYFYKKNNILLIGLVLVSGLAVLARPPVLFFIPIILFYFYKKKMWWQTIVFLLIFAAVLTPWTVRNYMTYGKILPFGVAGNFNLWIGNYHGATGEQEQKPEQYEFVANHEIKEVGDESIRQFKDFLFKYPFEFIKLTILRINKYFSIIRPMGFWFYQKGTGQFLFIFSSALASVFLFVFGIGGAIRSLKHRTQQLNYLLAFTLITPLIIFVSVVETRYRFQIYPLLAIFAAYFFYIYVVRSQKWWADKVLWLSILIISANGFVDLILSIEKFKEKLGSFF
jgi:4-amino-4-deoxy-L-arabinose transferase-like glycosyltransferase